MTKPKPGTKSWDELHKKTEILVKEVEEVAVATIEVAKVGTKTFLEVAGTTAKVVVDTVTDGLQGLADAKNDVFREEVKKVVVESMEIKKPEVVE